MKSILSFICGMLATAAVVYEAQVRAGEMLLGGMLLGAAITIAIVWRMREKVFPVRETHRVHRVVERVLVPAAKSEIQEQWAMANAVPVKYIGLSAVEGDVASALANFGMSIKEAKKIVAMVKGREGMEFEELMRKCLERTRVKQ